MNDGIANTTAGHNAKARAGIIRSIMDALDDKDAEIASLQEDRKRIKGRIKADLGMKVSDFNVLRRFRQLDEEPEERDRLFDVLREGFQALGIGGQASFLDALDGIAVPAADRAVPMKGMLPTVEECETIGRTSFDLGHDVDAFPETIKTKARKEAYMRGWEARRKEVAAAALKEEDEAIEEIAEERIPDEEPTF